MGAGLGFKTFVTGDVLTASDTNGYLMQGVWVFASAAARDAAVTSPQEGNFCYLKDTNATQFYTGSAWSAVGNGKVLQVVNATYATEVSNSTNTYADTGLTANITCSSTSSKVLVIVTQNGLGKSAGNVANAIDLRLSLPGGSTIQFGYAIGYDGVAIERFYATGAFTYLHSPASVAAITYKTQFKNFTNAASVSVQNDGLASSSIVLIEIGA